MPTLRSSPDGVTEKYLKWRESFIRLLLSIYRLAGEGKSERGKFCGKFASSFLVGEGKSTEIEREVCKRCFMKTSNVGISKRLWNGLKDGKFIATCKQIKLS
jgi:hypothetical protein